MFDLFDAMTRKVVSAHGKEWITLRRVMMTNEPDYHAYEAVEKGREFPTPIILIAVPVKEKTRPEAPE